MSLIRCKECKKEISNKAEMCPHCGYKYISNSNTYSNRIKTGSIVSLIACSIIVLLLIGLIAMSSTGTENSYQSSGDVKVTIGLTPDYIAFGDLIYFLISIILTIICFIIIILFLTKKFKKIKMYKWILLLISISQLICSIISIRALACCGMIYTIFPLINVIGAIIASTGETK